MADFSQLRPVDVGGSFLKGLEHGQEMSRRNTERHALSAFAQDPKDEGAISALIGVNPALGLQLQQHQREQAKLDARRAVFAPQPGVLSAMPSALAPPQGVVPPVAGGAPATLLDSRQLPPRTDGLQVNHEALRSLYQEDPDAALDIQKMIYSADAASAKRMQESGQLLATAAYRLSSCRSPSVRLNCRP